MGVTILIPPPTVGQAPTGTDHNALTNLTVGDPHSQYAQEAAANTFTATNQFASLKIKGPNPWVDPTHAAFGAIGDGTSRPLSTLFGSLGAAQAVYPHAVALTDELDWAAIQAAINYAISTKGGYVRPPSGIFVVNRPFTVSNFAGFRFSGQSGHFSGVNVGSAWLGGTMFSWVVDDKTMPFFILEDTNSALFEDFLFKCNASFHCQAGFVIYNTSAAANVTPTQNTWRNVHFDGNTSGIDVGWWFSPSTFFYPNSLDNNNDYNSLYECTCYNMRVAGALINGSQSKANLFRNCQFRGYGTDFPSGAQVGVGAGYWYDADTATHYDGGARGGTAGSFNWDGGGMSWIGKSAFHLGGGEADVININGGNIEKIARLFSSAGPSSTAIPINIRGTRVGNAGLGTWNADLRFIALGHPGPLTLDGCTIADDVGHAITIYADAAAATDLTKVRAQVTVRGSQIYTTNNTSQTLFPAATQPNTRFVVENSVWNNLTTAQRGPYLNTAVGEQERSEQYEAADRTAASLQSVGMVTRTITSPVAATAVLDAQDGWLLATSNTINVVAEIAPAVFSHTAIRLLPIFDTVFTINSLTSRRLFVGLFSAAVPALESLATVSALALRHSSGSSDTNWQVVTSNGSAQTVIDTGVAAVAASRTRLRIDCTDSARIRFFINEKLVAIATATLPAIGTPLGAVHHVTPLASSTRQMHFAYMRITDA